MKTLTPSPVTDPRAVGPVATRAGNVFALRVAADKGRDAGRDDTAAKLDLLAGEFDIRCLQARQLRAVLAALASTAPVAPWRADFDPMVPHVREFVNNRGLPVDVAQVSKSKALPLAFLVLMPTDGEGTAETVARLGAVLGARFPDATFLVFPVNLPTTTAGREADKLLDKLECADEQVREAA